jgi:RND family efflux transporter MFP subunit
MLQRKWWVGCAAIAVVIGAGGVYALRAGHGSGGDKKASDDVPLEFTTKEVAQPRMLALGSYVSFSGPLVAPSTAIVRAKSPGTLVSLSVNEGSRVAAGERLGVIDLADLTARLNEKQAQAEAARAQLAQAERTQASNQRLAEQQFISSNALDASRAALDTARAQYNAALAQVETVRISLRDAALVAPISGIVAKRHAVPGEKVAAEQQLLTIVDLRSLEMAGSVGTHEVSQLHTGMSVELQVEGSSETISGKLARISPAAEAGTRSIGVTVVIDNPKEAFRAGQFASAKVLLPTGAAQPTVPITALASASGQDYVWTVEKGKLLRRTVVTGRRDPARGLVEVKEGLPADALVLSARFDNLREGAPAKVAQASAPDVATSSASTPKAL